MPVETHGRASLPYNINSRFWRFFQEREFFFDFYMPKNQNFLIFRHIKIIFVFIFAVE